ncbi:MAG: SDR family NAD(P)-dependent oxidoreductase [Pseudomonadota bacterium]
MSERTATNRAAQKVLITGGTDGLGRRLALAYARDGADVMITGRRTDLSRDPELASSVRYVLCDQSDPEGAVAAIADGLELAEWEHCDIAILNAGSGWVGDALEQRNRVVRDTVNVNMVAPLLIARTLSTHILASGTGTLALIGSTARKGAPNFAAYAAAKAGLNGFARSLKEEWRGKANVLMLNPGPIATDMHAKAGLQVGAIGLMFLHPEFVARAVRYAVRKGRAEQTIGHGLRFVDLISFGWIWRK